VRELETDQAALIREVVIQIRPPTRFWIDIDFVTQRFPLAILSALYVKTKNCSIGIRIFSNPACRKSTGPSSGKFRFSMCAGYSPYFVLYSASDLLTASRGYNTVGSGCFDCVIPFGLMPLIYRE
jgi:hypothetical protein